MTAYLFQKYAENFAFHLFIISNLEIRTAIIAKISVFVICIEETIYLLLYNLHDCTINGKLHFFCTVLHFVKSVSIRSFSGPHFSTFGLNREIFSRIQSERGKMQNGKAPNTDTFYAVLLSSLKFKQNITPA